MENGQDQQQPTNDNALQEAQQQLDTARAAANHAEDAVQQAQDNTHPSQDELDTLRTKLEKLNAENRKLKDENGQRRVTAKEVEEKNEKLRKVAQLLGLEPDDDDPEALVKQAQQEAAERAKERDELQSQLNPLQENDHLRGLAKKAGCSPR